MKNELIYILMYYIGASFMPEYSYFKRICELSKIEVPRDVRNSKGP